MGAPDRDFAAWILGSMSSGIVAIDQDKAVVTLNAGAQRILGCPAGDSAAAIGRDCRKVLHAQPTVAQLLIDALHGRGVLSRAELVLEDVLGCVANTIGFTLTPVRDEDDRVRGAAMIFRDLTPLESNDEQQRLRERLAALGQMAAGLAHEIRNPLAGMEVVAGLLRRRLEGRPDEQALVAELTRELRSLADTVTASLEFVRPVSLVRSPTNPIELMEASLAVASSRVPFACEIDRSYDKGIPLLSADADQLRAVITNLIVNAFEAMADQGESRQARLRLGVHHRAADRGVVSVRVGDDGRAVASYEGATREVVITVSDTGAGVPAQLREKIFYPFFSTKQGGSGVGLAMAQKIVASHGGVIELDGPQGAGCTFRIRLPADEARGQPDAGRRSRIPESEVAGPA